MVRNWGALIFLLYSVVAGAVPRLGLETETAVFHEDGQDLRAPSDNERSQKTRQILDFWHRIFGGEVTTIDGRLVLDWGSEKPGTFNVDREWASDLRQADGYELVTPPLTEEEFTRLADQYDEFLGTLQLGSGIKTSQQFNIELRDLIPGFSLQEKPTSKMGVSFSDIENANVDKVVNLFLYLEQNVRYIYAAFAPKRLGRLVNYFALPTSFEHDDLLVELASLPPEQRTYGRVRNIFLKYNSKESEFSKYGDRTDWKYRTFNLRKFFAMDTARPAWVYPALEVRIPDTPISGTQLKKQGALTYALFRVGSETRIGPEEVKTMNSDYRKFLLEYREKLGFERLIRIINQDIVERALTPEFREGYAHFLKDLGMKGAEYVPFVGAEPSPFVSQTFDVYSMLRGVKATYYGGRVVKAPILSLPWDLSEFSFGAEFEFSERQGIVDELKKLEFLEPDVTIESTGNREVVTKPTNDMVEILTQIQFMRDVLGDDLRSIHLNFRFPKSLYERVSKQKFDTWIARVGDWISSLRANYRQSKYAFRTRTQNRVQVDTPNAWIADNKAEYRGTMRIYFVGDKMNVEVRGLMDGVFKQAPLEPDLHIVSMLILLQGIHHPELIEGNYSHRLISEVRDPGQSFQDMMARFAAAKKSKLEGLPHTIAELVSALRAPNLMLLPLMGFEYSPLFMGHDIKRLEHATLNWKNEVWEILIDTQLDSEGAKQKFADSLKNWSRTSGIEHALFDSLLVQPAQGLKWQDLNLPVERLRARFLAKMIQLQTSEFAKAGIELFLVSWMQKGRPSFVAAGKTLNSNDKRKIAEIIDAHLSPQKGRVLYKELEIETGSANHEANPILVRTNLTALLEVKPFAKLTLEQEILASSAEQMSERLATYVASQPQFQVNLREYRQGMFTTSASDSIGLLLNVAPLIEPGVRDQIMDKPVNSLAAYIVHESSFNLNGDESLALTTMQAMAKLLSLGALISKLEWISKWFEFNVKSTCPMDQTWKKYVRLVDHLSLAPEARIKALRPAINTLLAHYRAERRSWSGSTLRNHINAFAPYVTNEILENNRDLIEDFRALGINYGPPGLPQTLPPAPVRYQESEVRRGSYNHRGNCDRYLTGRRCASCPHRH